MCLTMGLSCLPDILCIMCRWRVVCVWNRVWAHNVVFAIVYGMADQPVTTEASCVPDAYGALVGNAVGQADAEQVYVQAMFECTTTYMRRPHNNGHMVDLHTYA